MVGGWRYASQSYDLEPDSPVVIQTLAGAWQSVGVEDKAERLLLDGLEIAGNNFSLQASYFFLLLKQGRIEKAEMLIREQYGDSVDELPEQLQQFYYFQKGMISLVVGERDTAGKLIEQAIGDDSEQILSNEQILFITLSSVLLREAGNAELAEQRLSSAEHAVRRARINGADDAGIYYTETSILALRGESQAALDSLQTAYEKGFRTIWMLDYDLRLESLYQEPQFVAIKAQIERDIVQARTEVESFAIAEL